MRNKEHGSSTTNKDSTIFWGAKWPSRQAWCQAGQQQHMQTWNMKTTETHSRHKKETCQSQKFGHNQIGKNRDTSDKTTKSVNVTTWPS